MNEPEVVMHTFIHIYACNHSHSHTHINNPEINVKIFPGQTLGFWKQ